MKLQEITDYLEDNFPLSLQESYDNSGLLVGNKSMELKSALICLDSTEEVVDEAIRKGANLIISHHPIIFSGIKRKNGCCGIFTRSFSI
jgi:putative NIF3 family GTP cyclohydrolase 1 type 2